MRALKKTVQVRPLYKKKRKRKEQEKHQISERRAGRHLLLNLVASQRGATRDRRRIPSWQLVNNTGS
jgi:hypothetical protein